MVAMTSPLHRAAERPFCVCQLNCSQTPASTSNLIAFLESQWNVDSNNVLSVRRCYQIITHESNTFLLQNTPLKLLGQRWQTNPKSTLPVEACGPHLIWMPGVTPLTTPNDSLTAARTSSQLCNKGPISYNGTPQIHPQNCPFSFDNHHPL